MKIICDNCRTKYSIADEKVQGKVFKIRCKKCQNIIVVRGNQSGDESASGVEEDLSGRATIETKDTPVWHLVVGREQVGPMTGAEVRERFGRGEIDTESYIWREGFADWQRLTSVPDFSDMAQAGAAAPAAQPAPVAWSADTAPAPSVAAWSAAPAAATAPASWDAAAGGGERAWASTEDTARADSANLFGGNLPDSGRDLFSSQGGQDPAADQAAAFAAPAAGPASGGGMFSAPAAAEAGDMFAVAPAPAATGNGGQGQVFSGEERGGVQMTGARHENSVLFSLTNLQALAMGGKSAPAPSPSGGASTGGDGSGLIDIRSMAFPTSTAATSSSAVDDLPDLGGGFAAPIAAPVLMPTMVEERPKWILPTVIGLGGVVMVVLVVLVVVLMTRKPPEPVAVVTPPVATQVPPPAVPKVAEKTAVVDTKEPTKVAENKAEEPKGGKKAGKGGKRAGKGGPKGTKGAVAVAKAEQPEPKAAPAGGGRPARKSGRGDDLDALIDGAMGGNKKAAKKVAAAPAAAAGGGANLPDSLSRSEIQGGMRKIKDRVQGCYDKFRVPGTAFVSVTISPSGSITGAKVKGIFAGTPTGACLQAATRSATFPRFKGPAITIDYPFILR